MKITSIPQIYRNVNRWGEIFSVLSKYELANWIGRLGPDFAKDLLKARSGAAIARLSWETRMRMAMLELGPTFIKLGQILSTRPDLIGVRLAKELQQLQTDVPADPPEVARKTVAEELGCDIDDVFAEFNDVALASASIGQVHEARLHSGERVVVKVLHKNIEKTIAVDMDILAGLAQLADRVPEFRGFRPQSAVAEFRRAIERELDFRRELQNMEEFTRDFAKNPALRIPHPYRKFSSRRVLTMEFLEGIPISDTEKLEAAGYDREKLACSGADIYLDMMFTYGLYHADPHPGNIIIVSDDVIGLLDFGMIGRINDRLQENVADMLMAMVGNDPEQLASIITRIGTTPLDLDYGALSIEVADFVGHYGSMPLDQFDLSGALTEMTEMIRRYNILLPAGTALLIKVLITIEGTARLLSPKFSLVEVLQPYHKKLLWRRLSPIRRAKKLHRLYSEVEHLVELLPRGVLNILQQVESGKFDVHLDHRGLEPSVNRLVLGMLASALFLGSAMMLSNHVPPLLGAMSVPGAITCGFSIALGLRLWRAISKSGHLDRRQ